MGKYHVSRGVRRKVQLLTHLQPILPILSLRPTPLVSHGPVRTTGHIPGRISFILLSIAGFAHFIDNI